MRYVNATYRKEVKDLTYRVYVTDCLKEIGHLTGQRYAEVVSDFLKPAETRTGQEIIDDIKTGINNI